jgi:hypothetical protein
MVSRRESHRRSRGWAVAAIAAIACLGAPAGVTAAAKDVYVLDISRPHFPILTADPAPGRIIQVDPNTGAELREVPAPHGPEVQPLRAPTGIAVDAHGYLIVADTDGYRTTISYPAGGSDPCQTVDPATETGCGAILRVNPVDGSATLLSTGAYSANPSAILLPPDRNLIDDQGGPEDQLLVVDTASRGVYRIDPSLPVDANQTVFYENYSKVNPALGNLDAVPGKRVGLRNPWDIARDPGPNGIEEVTDDVLITNLGVRQQDGTALGETLESIGGCDDDGDASNGSSEADGYIARIDPANSNQVESYICDPEFRKPRGIVVGPDGRAFVADPFVVGEDAAGQSQFAGVFQVDLNTNDVQMLSLGGELQAPSGLSFTYQGNALFVADESLYPPPNRPDCSGAGGCGGVLALDPFSGEQDRFSSPSTTPATFYRDPIDVVVDRTGAPKPLKRNGVCLVSKCCKPGGKKCKPERRARSSITFFNLTDRTKAFDDGSGVETLDLNGFGELAKVRVRCKSSDCRAATKTVNANRGHVAFRFNRSSPLRGQFEITASDKRRNIKQAAVGRFLKLSFNPGEGAAVRPGTRGCLEPGAKKLTGNTKLECPEPDTR